MHQNTNAAMFPFLQMVPAMPTERPDDSLSHLIHRASSEGTLLWDAAIDAAAEELRRVTRRQLSGFSRLKRWEETDDVFQTAMLRFRRSLRDVRPESSGDFFRLAATQIRRTLLDLTRHYFGPHGHGRNYRSDIAGPSERARGYIGNQADSESAPESLEEWTAFHEAVSRLPQPERDVFQMKWYLNMDQSAVAAALGISVSSVKRRWHTARVLLHGQLTNEPE